MVITIVEVVASVSVGVREDVMLEGTTIGGVLNGVVWVTVSSGVVTGAEEAGDVACVIEEDEGADEEADDKVDKDKIEEDQGSGVNESVVNCPSERLSNEVAVEVITRLESDMGTVRV